MRLGRKALAVLFCLGLQQLAIGNPAAQEPRPTSDHFDGSRYHNRVPYTMDGFWDKCRLFWSIAIH